ncbi:PREDICTED: uncharacterized protein LOC107189161 [Dufourea novaeangliae]|uniref:Uncharacterized protein n=1 Tax=Dufourea novaeangliae TaxID=178035 RepID=A0A154PH41_DUFNO|nr:PREDICTED: uncharacterized protein LOC107189161 [Dufourea novaeangliae]KZC11132.1 hypothetical protein WN55_02493 [Dufourea novaeangliae]
MNGKLLIVLSFAVFATAKDEATVANMETRLTRAMDDLNRRDTIKIYGDMFTLEKVDVDQDVAIDRASEDTLVCGIEKFLRTRRFQIHFPNDGSPADMFGRALGQKDVGVELRGLTEGASEARTKLKKIILPLLLALKLKAIIVLPIVITLIGLIGIKGLGAGLMSLLLSGAVALKSLLTPPPPYPARVTYGIVKPDVHHEHWHRSQEEVNQPYRGWAPEFNPEQYPYQDAPL